MTSFSTPLGAIRERSLFPQSLCDPPELCGILRSPKQNQRRLLQGTPLFFPCFYHTRTSQGIHDIQSPAFPVTRELVVEPEQLRQLKVINIS